MKLIIAGTRTIKKSTAKEAIDGALRHGGMIPADHTTMIVTGERGGVDLAGRDVADERGMRYAGFPVLPGRWQKIGKRAGPERNRLMAEYADALLLIWNGKSSGSASMKREAEAADLLIYEILL